MFESLNGKVAVVTGGSSGIGAATVRRLAEEGATVAVGYNTGRERADALIAELPGDGHRAVQITLDDGASVRAAAAEVEEAFGRCDVLVNSAGFTKPIPHGDLDALDDEFFDKMLITNVRGPFSVVRAFRPMLQASGNGVIVNISSVSGFTGSGSSLAYAACKGALDIMTMSLARALGPEIRVLSVSPAAVPTEFVAGRDRARVEKIAEGIPLKRTTEPEDVADAVLACITHLHTATGTRIVIDGGHSLV